MAIFAGTSGAVRGMLSREVTNPGRLLRALVFIVAAWVLCGLSDPAAAQELPHPPEHRNLPATADAYGIVFDQWVARRKPATAILAVRRDGQTIAVRGHSVD